MRSLLLAAALALAPAMVSATEVKPLDLPLKFSSTLS
jgi:hypothetical protein